jgi:hypothetical protein
MRTFLTALLGLAVIAALLLLDNYLFARWLGLTHWQWYLANGSLISVVVAIFSIAWGDVNKHTGLIAAHPLDYLGSQLQLVGLPLLSLGTQFRSDPAAPSRPSLLDVFLSIPVILLVLLFFLIYLLAVVPLQYFVFLACGAPARVTLESRRKLAARLEGGQVNTVEMMAGGSEPVNWWNAGMNQKPVTITTLIASLAFIALKTFIR